MKVSYSPESGQFTVYATSEEFQLAVTDDSEPEKFRVIMKDLKRKDGSVDESAVFGFINDFVHFVKRVFGDLYSDEKIKDIIVLSTMPKLGYTWTSLLELENFGNSNNFLDLITSYAFKVIADTGSNKKTQTGKELMDILHEDDFAKLTLAKVILSSINHPTVWKLKQKPDQQKEQLEIALKSIQTKMSKFEKKYGFSSSEMERYYGDDKYPEKDMEQWLKLYNDSKVIVMSLEKYGLVERLVKEWKDSFAGE